jgi:hypothetical protein
MPVVEAVTYGLRQRRTEMAKICKKVIATSRPDDYYDNFD